MSVSIRLTRLLALLPLAGACDSPDGGLKVHNDAPVASIDSPTDGATIVEGVVVVLSGSVSDPQDAPDALLADWLVDGMPVCADLVPGADGAVTCETTFSADALVELKATDSRGAVGEDSVSVVVQANEPPTIDIVRPDDTLSYYRDLPTAFEAVVTDDLDDPTALVVSWTTGDTALPMTGAPDSDGTWTASQDLDAGTHVLKATVTDTGGKTASDTVTIVVYDENTPPECGFTSPDDGACFVEGDTIVLEGTARDDQTAPDLLGVSLDSSIDGALTDAIVPTTTGTWTWPTDVLSAGTHSLTLTVEDDYGDRCVETLVVEVSDTVWYRDQDNDGYGSPADTLVSCTEPSGYVATGDDCDDADPHTYPGAARFESATACMTDVDGDGYGATLVVAGADAGADCDDADPAISPAATEVCDSVDNDCDGDIDDDDASVDPGTLATWYADTDADGYGDASAATGACDAPSGHVTDDTDCDDTDSAVHPGATEVCDSADTDEDCSGLADDADSGVDTSTYSTWYADSDSDGYGDPAVTTDACDAPAAHVADDTDCDDTDSAVHPRATEVCDAADTDEDCSGTADDADPGVDPATHTTWYADTDADGEGDPGRTTAACDSPTGYVSNGTDCDDTDATVGLTATEVCDSQDNDCDTLVDDADPDLDSSTASTWYEDADADGFGDATVTALTCAAPSGYVTDNTDCDDTFAYTYPGATELCDGQQNDCDDTSWTDDAGLVSLETTAGAWSDDTATWAAGISALPASISLSSDGTAHVCEGTWYVALDVSADVEVVGEDGADDVILSGGDNDTVVTIQTDAITVGLTDLTIRDGVGTHTPARLTTSVLYGGGVYCEALSNLDLTRTIITENTAYNAAGLSSEGCDVTADSVEWTANTASNAVAAAWGYNVTWVEANSTYIGNEAPAQGGARFYGSDVTLTDILFDENTATTGGAAALHVGYSSTLDATGVDIWSNQSGTDAAGGEHYGGAVWLYSDTVATLTDVLVWGNTSDNIAGGVYVYDTQLDCVGCEVSNNYAAYSGGGMFTRTGSVVTFDSTSSFVGNTADEQGGGLVAGSTSVALDGTLFEDNGARTDGGGIYLDAGVELTIDNATFDSNWATRYGGGIYLDGDAVIDASTFEFNEASSQGGAIYLSTTGTLSVSNTLFGHNSANTSGSDGGAMHLRADSTIDTCVFTDNSAQGDGGALYIQNGAVVDITDSDFDGNTADSGAGGVLINDASTTTIDGGEFTDNSALYGGVFYAYNAGSTLTLDSVTVDSNAAAAGGGVAYAASGGAIEATDSAFTYNEATGIGADGGAFAIGTSSSLALTTCDVSNNLALDHGGGIATSGTGTTVTLDQTDITSNSAGSYGGGISASYNGGYPTLSISQGSIMSNSAITGGGIYAEANITVANTSFGATNSPNDTEVGSDSDNWGLNATFSCNPASCN